MATGDSKEDLDHSGGIAETDEVRELRRRIGTAEREAFDALCEADEIRLQVVPNLLVDYAVLIGCHENELFAASVELRRAKRRLALARKFSNRGEPVDQTEVDAQLDEEFERWQKELQERIRELDENIARRQSSSPLPEEDSVELKRIYRELMHRLHPDVNPNQTNETRRLFELAQQALADGDLPAMRAIRSAASLLGPDRPASGKGDAHTTTRVEDELAAHLALVEATRDDMVLRLNELRQTFPYPLRERLCNETWVNAQVSDIHRRIDECKKARDECLEQYRQLIGGMPDGEAPASDGEAHDGRR